MELPHMGVHCAVQSCHQLDFLPAKCSACEQQFCSEHLSFTDGHDCPKRYLKNSIVPVCPLCNTVIPVRRKGDAPDVLVSQHIDSDCQSDPAKEKRKIFDKRCAVKKCKKKELVPINCRDCRLNFCLGHRHPKDHDCGGPSTSNPAADAALRRQKNETAAASSNKHSKAARPSAKDIQGQLSEDEALAKALQESLNGASSNDDGMTQEEIDRMTALALQESLNQGGRSQASEETTSSGGGTKSCTMQ